MSVLFTLYDKGFRTEDNKILYIENFLTTEEYDKLLIRVESLSEEDWNTHPTEEHEQGKISINLEQTLAVSQKIIDLVIPRYWINEHKTVNRMRSTDIQKEFGDDTLSSADYLAVYYFGDFRGGNIKTIDSTKEDPTLEIKSNSLYLFPITNGESYISEPVTSGVKYSFIDWVYKHSGWAFP